MIMQAREHVKSFEILESQYVHVRAENTWAQMPLHEWNALKPGEEIPAKYVFNSEWHRVFKVFK